MSTNVVIFGGSFDPIHSVHVQLVQQAFLLIPNITFFYVIPTGKHPQNKQYMFAPKERNIMIKACFGLLDQKDKDFLEDLGCKSDELEPVYQDNRLHISDFEQVDHNISYAYDTVCHFLESHPGETLNLLLGADQASHFSSWYRAKEIASRVSLWIFPRGNYQCDQEFCWNVIDIPIQNVSSSDLKKDLILNKELSSKFVPFCIRTLSKLFLNNCLPN